MVDARTALFVICIVTLVALAGSGPAAAFAVEKGYLAAPEAMLSYCTKDTDFCFGGTVFSKPAQMEDGAFTLYVVDLIPLEQVPFRYCLSTSSTSNVCDGSYSEVFCGTANGIILGHQKLFVSVDPAFAVDPIAGCGLVNTGTVGSVTLEQ